MRPGTVLVVGCIGVAAYALWRLWRYEPQASKSPQGQAQQVAKNVVPGSAFDFGAEYFSGAAAAQFEIPYLK